MIHLDTSFLIRALIPGSPESHRLRDWIGSGEALIVNAVAWAEFLCGPLSKNDLEVAVRIAGQPHDFTPEHAAIAARLFNESGRRRGAMLDCMIAAPAIAEGALLATGNVDDFSRFVEYGLRLA